MSKGLVVLLLYSLANRARPTGSTGWRRAADDERCSHRVAWPAEAGGQRQKAPFPARRGAFAFQESFTLYFHCCEALIACSLGMAGQIGESNSSMIGHGSILAFV